MRQHRRTIIQLILILGFLDTPTAAADGITVVQSAAEYSFAQQVTFTLQATSSAQITQVYLFFRAAGDERTESVNIPVAQALEITASHVQDLRLYPLPPFSTITFWWQIDDAAGSRLTTETQEFTYADNRFQWEQLGDDTVSVYWIEGKGDPAFGQAALDIAQVSLEDINTELRAPLPPTVSIYIYDAQHNLDAAMVLAGRRWVGGQAHPDLGVVVIAIPNQEGYTSRMLRYIPHEISHLLVFQAVTPAGYAYVPEWLDEGLASANERLPTPDYAVALDQARAQGQLIPLGNLCVPFPPDSQTAFQSYAQSLSVVTYIRQQYGAPAIRDLLAAYADGSSCSAGVQNALHISLEELDAAWRASLQPLGPQPADEPDGPLPAWQIWMKQTGSWVVLWILGSLTALPMLGGLRRRRSRAQG